MPAPPVPPSAPARPARPRSAGRWDVRLGAGVLVGGAVGVVFASQAYLLTPDGTWGGALASAAPRWVAWGLVAPLVVALDRRALRSLRPVRRAAAHVGLAVPAVLAVTALRYLADLALLGEAAPLGVFVLRGVYWDALVYGLVAGLAVAWDATAEAARRDARAAALEADLAEARLGALQGQLRPHFLFNALNAISAFTETDAPTARRAMAHLGDLLRASLDHGGRAEVPLADELDALGHYVAVERLRFPDRLAVSVEAEPGTCRALVPSFLLQPLVENAVRHGAGGVARPVAVAVRVRREGGRLALSVEDDGAGLPAGWRLGDHGGVGLGNTARRLDALYGPDGRFRVGPGAGGRGVRVDVEVPFRPAPSPEAAPPVAASGDGAARDAAPRVP